jgi:hypothetical protein
VVDWKPHWALGYISVPPRRNINAGSGRWLNLWTRNYKYQRDDSECQGQYVYVVENQFDATHPVGFSPFQSAFRIKLLTFFSP